jgi:hypothetical protein
MFGWRILFFFTGFIQYNTSVARSSEPVPILRSHVLKCKFQVLHQMLLKASSIDQDSCDKSLSYKILLLLRLHNTFKISTNFNSNGAIIAPTRGSDGPCPVSEKTYSYFLKNSYRIREIQSFQDRYVCF